MANVGAGRVPGHAGVDQPLRQLAERVGRRADAGRVADHGRARAAHADRARAAVLRPAESGPGRGDHRCGRVRDDRRARAAPAASRHPVRLLDRRRRHRRRAVGGRPGRRRGRRRALAGLADLRRDHPADAAARPRARDAGVPRPRRAPRRRDVPRGRRCCGSTAASSSPPPSAGGPHPRAHRRRGQLAAWCSTSRRSPSSTLRAPSSSHRSTSLSKRRRATLRLAQVKPQVIAVLERDGVIDRIGADHVHGNLDRAVEAQLADNEWTGEATPRVE